MTPSPHRSPTVPSLTVYLAIAFGVAAGIALGWVIWG